MALLYVVILSSRPGNPPHVSFFPVVVSLAQLSRAWHQLRTSSGRQYHPDHASNIQLNSSALTVSLAQCFVYPVSKTPRSTSDHCNPKPLPPLPMLSPQVEQ